MPHLGFDWAWSHALPAATYFAELAALLYACWLDNERVETFLSSIVEDGDYMRVVVARVGFRLVGAAFFKLGTEIDDRTAADGYVRAYSILVDPECDGKGLEAALVAFLMVRTTCRQPPGR